LGPYPATGEQDAYPLDAFLRLKWPAWHGPTRFGEREEHRVGEDAFAALRFDATPGGVTSTRRFLRSTLTQWQLPDLVDDATTIAAELVANAVTHALRSPAPALPLPAEPTAWIALLRIERAVVCAVADPSPVPPAMSDPEPFAESGRGLRIVAELSETWGHSAPEPAGKTVWARLASGR
jgi:hypothetical protein